MDKKSSGVASVIGVLFTRDVTEDDRQRWDARYEAAKALTEQQPGPPDAFAGAEHLFPQAGTALDVACGAGFGSVWMARRGLSVWGVDVSPVAIDKARALATRWGVADRCRFDVSDLDDGLPDGPPVDVVLCHLFRDENLERSMIERLAPGGLLAVAVLSEVDAKPGSFRAPPGDLHRAFGELEILEEGERDGRAWMIARATT